MKTKNYRNGKSTCRTYMKTAGNGFEVGFIYGGKTLFVGNFVHGAEANRFFAIMKREISRFGRRFTIGKSFPQAWFKSFITAHLHRCYYNFVTTQVKKHAVTANRTFGKNLRTYKRLNRRWTARDKAPSFRAA